ncbi:hypothetical protein [Methylovirgula sp. 4M-Z18]|uniref:hypothetical protein n=1 Tax=Methylovirgula sp. 4M-Z18 TaxID=2293567 RepID=UPI0018F6D79D|nr:hypothetical protein [Methylovirgula sp. 4M-Z18]
MTILEQIDELRAELQGAMDAAERRQIEAELTAALAQRDIIVAKQNGRMSAEPRH